MRKLSISVALLSVFCATSGYAETSNLYGNISKDESQNTSSESASIKAIVEEIASAAQSGDEQLVSKLLASAIKSNPKIADKIVTAFINSQESISSNSKKKSINVSNIINDVIASLQNQKGNEALVAAVLSSYTPAAGGNPISERRNALPPQLPTVGRVGATSNEVNLSRENPHQISAH